MALLLQGGTILIHNAQDHVESIQADLLIEGNTISRIGVGLQASQDAIVIDCTDKILCPGFIDTHHHLWQTLLKGRHANQQLLDYFYTGNFTSSLHSASDLFWGQMGGCLECLDVGTTTVVDHAHLNYSPENSKAALAASVSSGLRSFFCYCPTTRVSGWNPLKFHQNMLEDWVIETLEDLATSAPFGNDRVQLGFAFDGWFLPKTTVLDLFKKVKELEIKLITTHSARNAIFGLHSLPEMMDSYGLLDSSVILSHASCLNKREADLIRGTGSHISSTPSTESQMALGIPVAFDQALDIRGSCSIGADCQANNSASLVSEMRLLLQSSRANYNQPFLDVQKFPFKLNSTVEEAFNLATINGARAIQMETRLGTLAAGKLADVLVFNTMSPSMLCAARQDPIAAIVLHSQPADIEMVIVDGVVRKEGGKLRSVELETGRKIWNDDGASTDTVAWDGVAKELLSRQEKLGEKVAKLDLVEARRSTIQAFYVDESKIVDAV